MGYSEQWDVLYRKGKHWSTWPWSDLVSYVKRYGDLKPGDSVLELGCGVGANIPFFLNIPGVIYHALDGSETAIDHIRKQFIGAANNMFIAVGDFTKAIPKSATLGLYKLIVDRAAVIHNRVPDIQQTIKNIEKVIAPDGVYIGIDWFSEEHSTFDAVEFFDEEDVGRYYNDAMFFDGEHNTLYNITEGPFKDVGVVHFTNFSELTFLWKGWTLSHVREKVDTDLDTFKKVVSFDFVARREEEKK